MIYLFYSIKPQDIYAIKYILESYENLMTISTVDAQKQKIQVTIAPDFEEECREILKDLQTKFEMHQLDEPANISQGNY